MNTNQKVILLSILTLATLAQPLQAMVEVNNIDAIDKDGDTVLLRAARDNQLGLVKDLVEKHADVNIPDLGGRTALHLAVCNNNLEMIKFLVQHGSDINKANNRGRTALHFAIILGCNPRIVAYLVEQGIDINKRDNYDNTARNTAFYQGHFNIVNYLYGCDQYKKGVPRSKIDGENMAHVANNRLRLNSIVKPDYFALDVHCGYIADMKDIFYEHYQETGKLLDLSVYEKIAQRLKITASLEELSALKLGVANNIIEQSNRKPDTSNMLVLYKPESPCDRDFMMRATLHALRRNNIQNDIRFTFIKQ